MLSSNNSVMLGAFLTACCVLLPSAIADSTTDFRIETDVTPAGQAEPIHQSVTVFHAGIAYDYSLAEPHRITVIDPAQDRVLFLDSAREVKTEVALSHLHSFMEGARKEMANSKMAPALEDANVVRVDEHSGTVVVGQNYFRYEAKPVQPDNPRIARLFAEFANASSCINAWQSPDRSPPSFARMQLNETLASRDLIPGEITRTTISSNGQEHVLQSRMHTKWQLADEDKKTAEKFATMVAIYPTIDVEDYFMATKPPGAASRAVSGSSVKRGTVQ